MRAAAALALLILGCGGQVADDGLARTGADCAVFAFEGKGDELGLIERRWRECLGPVREEARAEARRGADCALFAFRSGGGYFESRWQGCLDADLAQGLFSRYAAERDRGVKAKRGG